MNNNSLTFARASGHALATRNPLIAERAGRAAQAPPAVLAVPTATGHYTTWSAGLAYPDTRPRSDRHVGPGQARIAGRIGPSLPPNSRPGSRFSQGAARQTLSARCLTLHRQHDALASRATRPALLG